MLDPEDKLRIYPKSDAQLDLEQEQFERERFHEERWDEIAADDAGQPCRGPL